MMEQLVIANKTPQDPEQHETYFRSTIHLVRIAKCNIRNERSVLNDPNAGNFVSGSLTVLHALRTINTGVTETTSLKRALEDLVISHIFSLSKTDSEVQELLSYFKQSIITLLRDVLDSSGTGEPHFLRILEQCYKQALDNAGTLYCHKYFNYIDEVSLISLSWSGSYGDIRASSSTNTRSVCVMRGIQPASRQSVSVNTRIMWKRENKAWIGFWSQTLQTHPGGPTLFLPTELHQTNQRFSTDSKVSLPGFRREQFWK